MPGIVVTKQETISSIGDQGKIQDTIRVTFTVDDHGPFYRTFPSEGFNGINARAELEAFAREIRLLRGQP